MNTIETIIGSYDGLPEIARWIVLGIIILIMARFAIHIAIKLIFVVVIVAIWIMYGDQIQALFTALMMTFGGTATP